MPAATSSPSARMLYEMVTGARAFAGTSTADTLSAVIRAQPKRSECRSSRRSRSDLEKVILRCLRKDPQRRFQHIDDVKIALQDIKEESDSGAGSPAPIARTRRVGRIVALGAIVILVVGRHGVGAAITSPSGRPAPARRATHDAERPGASSYVFARRRTGRVRVGRRAAGQLGHLRHAGGIVKRAPPHHAIPPGIRQPKWSPDGRQIAFLRERPDGSTIQVVSALGGEDRKLSDFRGRRFNRLVSGWSLVGRGTVRRERLGQSTARHLSHSR